jgi:hypothetical protein
MYSGVSAGELRLWSETGRLRSNGQKFNNFIREPPIDEKLLSEKETEVLLLTPSFWLLLLPSDS